MIAGVCGGLGEYLKIDATLIRLFFILLAFGSGVGVLAYLLLWVIVPPEGAAETSSAETARAGADEVAERVRSMGDDVRRALQQPHPQAALLIGGSLIALGLIFLLGNLQIPWLRWLRFDVLWPLLLIAAGAVLIWRRVPRA
jgi:phage shock protein PspC (stress-responsive transcriptional regulator)